ncbi:MAG: glycosyltransferase family 39 protein [Candidatus Riflebacteria bacterium]|nr:glycosyltransferase family 39 protein [Candidatus Riflebacteria bacterium]
MGYSITKKHFYLLILLVLGAITRLYHLGFESIWLDEAGTVAIARKSIDQIVDHVAFFDVHPPLYYFLTHYWIALFGDSEFWLRMPSVIFGVLNIWIIFLIARKLFSENVGLISALLAAFSMFHIHYSQEARCYSLLALLVSISMFFFLRVSGKTPARSDYYLYICFTAFSLYTHNFAVFYWISQNIFFLCLIFFQNRRKTMRKTTDTGLCQFCEPLPIKKWLLLQFGVLIALLPYFPLLVCQLKGSPVMLDWIVKPGISNLFFSLVEFCGGITTSHAGIDFSRFDSWFSVINVALFVLFSYFGISKFWRNRPSEMAEEFSDGRSPAAKLQALEFSGAGFSDGGLPDGRIPEGEGAGSRFSGEGLPDGRIPEGEGAGPGFSDAGFSDSESSNAVFSIAEFPNSGQRHLEAITDEPFFPWLFCAIWFACGLIFPFLASLVFFPIYVTRCSIASFPPLIILVSSLLGTSDWKGKLSKLSILLLVFIFAGNLFTLYNYFHLKTKTDWRSATEYLESSAQPGDLILFDAKHVQIAFDYYSKRVDLIKKPFPNEFVSLADWQTQINGKASGNKRIWLLSAHSFDTKNIGARLLGRILPITEERKFFGITIRLFSFAKKSQ